MFLLQATDDWEDKQQQGERLLMIVSSLTQSIWQIHESDSLHNLLEEFEDLSAEPLSLSPNVHLIMPFHLSLIRNL